jgi:hypothetical protein
MGGWLDGEEIQESDCNAEQMLLTIESIYRYGEDAFRFRWMNELNTWKKQVVEEFVAFRDPRAEVDLPCPNLH